MYWFKKNLFFSVVFRIGFEFYLQFYFASLYNLRNIRFKDVTDYYSIAVSMVWQLLPLVLLISTMIILGKFKKKYTQDWIKESRSRILLEDFKDNKKYLMVDHILFMIRRILLSFLIVFGWQNGIIQVCTFFLICLGVLILKLFMRPYNSPLLNIQNISFEIILLAVIGIFGSFYKKINRTEQFWSSKNIRNNLILISLTMHANKLCYSICSCNKPFNSKVLKI